ncbi:MAG: polysaccharide deacetylase family protein [Capsulimonadaceae bacterium]
MTLHRPLASLAFFALASSMLLVSGPVCAAAHTARRSGSTNDQATASQSPDQLAPAQSNQVETTVPERYRPANVLEERVKEEQRQGLKFAKLVRGNRARKQIALTFDDGPHPYFTQKLLAILEATHTPAMFFVIGKQVDKYPDLVRLEKQAGFEVGNHTYDHVDLTQIPPELIGFELDQCAHAVKTACGADTHFFRPPGGNYDVNVIGEATRRHYVTTLWTDDPGDYAKPGADIVLRRTLGSLENGAVILLHDGIPDTLSILPQLITEARRRGYQFVTVSALAAGSH